MTLAQIAEAQRLVSEWKPKIQMNDLLNVPNESIHRRINHLPICGTLPHILSQDDRSPTMEFYKVTDSGVSLRRAGGRLLKSESFYLLEGRLS